MRLTDECFYAHSIIVFLHFQSNTIFKLILDYYITMHTLPGLAAFPGSHAIPSRSINSKKHKMHGALSTQINWTNRHWGHSASNDVLTLNPSCYWYMYRCFNKLESYPNTPFHVMCHIQTPRWDKKSIILPQPKIGQDMEMNGKFWCNDNGNERNNEQK